MHTNLVSVVTTLLSCLLIFSTTNNLPLPLAVFHFSWIQVNEGSQSHFGDCGHRLRTPQCKKGTRS